VAKNPDYTHNQFLLVYSATRPWRRYIGGTMEYLLVLNDSPFGSQRSYNALSFVGALAKGATMEVPFSCRMTVSSADCECNPRRMRPITFRKCCGFWLRKVSQSVPAALVWKRVGLTMPRSSLASTAAPWTTFALGQRKQRRCQCSDPARRRMRALQNIEHSQFLRRPCRHLARGAGSFGTEPFDRTEPTRLDWR
jgi:hypothetical protein